MAFPVIDIVRTLKDASGNQRVHAEINREINPNLVEINGTHFDAIERGLTEGVNIGHYFYFLIVVIVHELGHYLYGCVGAPPSNPFRLLNFGLTRTQIYYGQRIGTRGQRVKPFPYLPDLDIRFDPGEHPEFDPDAWPTPWPPAPDGLEYRLDTPRRLRVNLGGVGRGSEPRVLTRRNDASTWGEMGEIIEWLVFGFLSQININGNPLDMYRIICWGSNSINPGQQIQFDGYVGTRLYTTRPPVRMGADELRFYIAGLRREEAVYLEAERAARRAFQGAVMQVGVDAANALGDAERLRVYGTAPGPPRPELFRLRPQNAYVYREYPRGANNDGAGDGAGAALDPMEIDLPSDGDEHYTAREIPRGRRRFMRYRECVRRINVETHIRGNFRKAIKKEQHNNPEPARALELGVPPSVFPRVVWESLRLILALSLPVGIFWAFQLNMNQIEVSGVWLVPYVCCFSLPLHTTRRLFPWIGRIIVEGGHLFALFLALLLFSDLPGMVPQLSPVMEWSDVLMWGLLLLGSWKVFWWLWLIILDRLGWLAIQLLFSSEILRRLTAWLWPTD